VGKAETSPPDLRVPTTMVSPIFPSNTVQTPRAGRLALVRIVSSVSLSGVGNDVWSGVCWGVHSMNTSLSQIGEFWEESSAY
jgi:hypothetical protein